MRSIRTLPILLLPLLVAGCSYMGSAPREAASSEYGVDHRGLASASEDSGRVELGDGPTTALFFADDDDIRTRPENEFDQPLEKRKVIYTGAIEVEVPRVEDALARVRKKVEDQGGYLERRNGPTVTFRVPAERFEATLAFCRTLGRVLNEGQQAMDVTDQWRDLGIRLDNARRSRERLLELLERAEAVKDILEIETELRRLTTEIERMEGELKSLEDRVAMATLTVELAAAAAPTPTEKRARPSRFQWINSVGADRAMHTF